MICSSKATGSADRLLADGAGGNLHVLLADGADDVAGGQVAGGEFVRVEPDAHRIVARAENPHVARAGNAGQDVLDLQGGVVAQINLVVAAVGREQVDDHGEVRAIVWWW